MKLSTLRQYWSVWIQVQVECFSTPQLFEQYLRLGGPDVQAIFKPRAPIEQMIDGATGYDKVRKEEQRKVMDKDLRESEEKHRIILEESSDPIFSFTPEGQYRFANLAFAQGVGKTPEDIIETKLSFIDHIGLQEHLSPTRSNGLSAMIKQMKLYAMVFKMKAA